jgi:hypothetical protein
LSIEEREVKDHDHRRDHHASQEAGKVRHELEAMEAELRGLREAIENLPLDDELAVRDGA